MAKVHHPVWAEPTLEDASGLAAVRGMGIKEAWLLLQEKRLEKIANERADPLLYGWEPAIWHICDALLGLDWAIPEWLGVDFGPRVRRIYGITSPWNLLLINGGNRAGKSEYMAKRAMQCLLRFGNSTLWAFHTDGDMSREYQQPLFWKYMPRSLKGKAVMSKTTYIAYKAKTGFSENSFILPNASMASFRNYAQEKAKIEGGELGQPAGGSMEQDEHGRFMKRCIGFVADELIPADWVETLTLRLSTRGACGIIGFTPVAGYTETVKLFQDGAETVKYSTAYLLPNDGGDGSDECLRTETHEDLLSV